MKATIVGIVKETDQVDSYYLEPSSEVSYKPGDFIYLNLPLMKYSDIKGNIRHFSLSSSPTEGQILRISVKQGVSGFKKTLASLRIGNIVEVEGPIGVYPWPYESENQGHVFIAGGIGVTPFRSRLKFNLDTSDKEPLTLLYSNSNLETMLFKDEIENFSKNMESFQFLPISSQSDGRIDKKLLSKLVDSNKSAVFWLTGPVGFVTNIEAILYKLGVDPDRLKTEKFTGYL